MFYSKVLIVDIETSGLNPQEHSILSIGAVQLDENLSITQQKYWLVKPLSPYYYSQEALRINGFETFDFSQHEYAEHVIHKFHSIFGQQEAMPILCGWNVGFDQSFLKELYKIYKLQWPFDYHLLDLQSIARFRNDGMKTTLHSELKKHGKMLSHNALQDALDEAFLLQQYHSNN